MVTPLERLGRWDGTTWRDVAPGSITAPRVHVLTHGWGPGMRRTVDAAGEFLRVWDSGAVTEDGKRFDVWFGPLADAILADDADAAVLAYSWIDESATNRGRTRSVTSQLRTTLNGQRLSVALRSALRGLDHDLHLIGYSHGAKVVAVAAALVDPVPRHLTILDSPDSLLPAIGGALNDLGSYLRLLTPGVSADDSFAGEFDAPAIALVDNYVSHHGTPYGALHGLGSIVDVTLDPGTHPLPDAPSPHGYAWAWYVATAADPSHGVGYAWSPLRAGAPAPPARQLRQSDGHPFALQPNPDVTPAGVGARLRSRVGERVDVTITLTTTRHRTRGLFWRRSGDLWASVPVTWRSGPDDASLRVHANRTERARSTKGWSSAARRPLHVPLGAARAGPMLVTFELHSSRPAEVEIGRPVAVNGFALPFGAERASWIRLAFWTAGASLVGAAVLASRWAVRRVRGPRRAFTRRLRRRAETRPTARA